MCYNFARNTKKESIKTMDTLPPQQTPQNPLFTQPTPSQQLPLQRNRKTETLLKIGFSLNILFSLAFTFLVLLMSVIFNDTGADLSLLRVAMLVLLLLNISQSVLLLNEVSRRVDHYTQRLLATGLMTVVPMVSIFIISPIWNVVLALTYYHTYANNLPDIIEFLPSYLAAISYAVGFIWLWVLIFWKNKVMIGASAQTTLLAHDREMLGIKRQKRRTLGLIFLIISIAAPIASMLIAAPAVFFFSILLSPLTIAGAILYLKNRN